MPENHEFNPIEEQAEATDREAKAELVAEVALEKLAIERAESIQEMLTGVAKLEAEAEAENPTTPGVEAPPPPSDVPDSWHEIGDQVGHCVRVGGKVMPLARVRTQCTASYGPGQLLMRGGKGYWRPSRPD